MPVWVMPEELPISLLATQQGLLPDSVIDPVDFPIPVESFLVVRPFIGVRVVDDAMRVELTLFRLFVPQELAIVMSSLVARLSLSAERSLGAFVVVVSTLVVAFVVERLGFPGFVLVVRRLEAFRGMSFFVTRVLFSILVVFS